MAPSIRNGRRQRRLGRLTREVRPALLLAFAGAILLPGSTSQRADEDGT